MKSSGVLSSFNSICLAAGLVVLAGFCVLAVAKVPLSVLPSAEAAEDDGHDHDHGHDHDDGHAEDVPATTEPESDVEMCGEHDVPESVCAICQPQRAGTLTPGEGLRLRLPSPDAADKAGVVTGAPTPGGVEPSGKVPVHVAYEPTAVARIESPAEGTIEKVFVEVGARVDAGAPLLQVRATAVSEARATLAAAQARADLARKYSARQKEVFDKKISAAKDYDAALADVHVAEAEVAAARRELAQLGAEKTDDDTLIVRAPMSGVVLDVAVAVGERAHDEEALMNVGNVETMALELRLDPAQAANITTGTALAASFADLPGINFDAQTHWIDTKLDETTRTVKARARVANPGGVLREGMLGTAVFAAAATGAVAVPANAIQTYDGQPFVFVALEAGLYDVRRVALGRRSAAAAEVTAGLQPDERIVLDRAYTVKSEFLKARLGAGCADH